MGSVYETPSLNRFVAAAMTGNMPGNVKTELPLFPASDLKYFSTAYKEWAPEPFNKMPGPQDMLGPSTPESPAPIIRIMFIMSGLADFSEMAFSLTPPPSLERSFKAVKTKVA